jgi:TolA-binding protein
MIPEFPENDRLRQFEDALRSPVSDHHIDYGGILNGVFERFSHAESEGPLSMLKLEELVPGTLLQVVEVGVNKRIAEYLEFDEPVDQCIIGDRKVPERYWRYLEMKLNEKIDGITPIAPEEQVLKADEILEQGKVESIEKALFARIRDYENERKVADKVTSFFSFSRILPIAASVLLAVSAICGYLIYRDSIKTIPSVLYQAQGESLDAVKTEIPSRGVVQSEKGGSLTIVNAKGYVELRNGSKLEIVKASEKEVLYHTRFADADNQLVGQGSATFFVNHQKKREKYTVATRDYRIEVTGTYFRLQPDIDGHVSVAVREGEVKIVFNAGETKLLKAGQTLAYDLNSNTFSTLSDGITVPRQEIEQFPDIKDLNEYRRVLIKSTPSAVVRIDDRYVGMTPLLIMQPIGEHSLSMEKTGFRTIDTAFSVTEAAAGVYSFALMETPTITGRIARKNQRASVPTRKAGRKQPEAAATTFVSAYTENDFYDAENLESQNWQKAFALYRNVFQNPRTPKLRKETALFSMAKLEAEHETDKTKAKEAFLHYLALFPTGNFVGESWLRLAELEFENDQNKSIEYYQRYFEKYPRHSRISELQYRVGLIYLQRKKYDDAISMFKLSLANYQGSDTNEKEKIKTSLYKALKEKNESQTDLPASANAKAP